MPSAPVEFSDPRRDPPLDRSLHPDLTPDEAAEVMLPHEKPA
ncbi:MAG TPA: hypothetical protein VIT89_03045 [Solirubrobacterales bacterium]